MASLDEIQWTMASMFVSLLADGEWDYAANLTDEQSGTDLSALLRDFAGRMAHLLPEDRARCTVESVVVLIPIMVRDGRRSSRPSEMALRLRLDFDGDDDWTPLAEEVVPAPPWRPPAHEDPAEGGAVPPSGDPSPDARLGDEDRLALADAVRRVVTLLVEERFADLAGGDYPGAPTATDLAAAVAQLDETLVDIPRAVLALEVEDGFALDEHGDEWFFQLPLWTVESRGESDWSWNLTCVRDGSAGWSVQLGSFTL